MAKVVAYTLLTAATIIILVFCQNGNSGRDKKYMALNRRLGIKIPKLHFNPLVTEIQRRDQEKNTMEAKRKTADEKDAFFTDGGKLNMTLRLMVLFPLLDDSPKGRLVTFEELEAWNLKQASDRLMHRTQTELEFYDKDRDGSVSFKEYLPQFSEEEIEKNKTGHGEAGWWKVQFTNADVDRNENLSFSEFMEQFVVILFSGPKNRVSLSYATLIEKVNNFLCRFLNPEDSNNTEIQKWILVEKVKRMDYTGDVKLDIHEFQNNVYEIYKSYIEFETGSQGPKPEEKFDELEMNKDKALEVEVLLPIFHYLNPGEISHAKYFTRHLIHEVDDNKDGKLSLEEMVNHEESFYGSLFEEEDDDDLHDEL